MIDPVPKIGTKIARSLVQKEQAVLQPSHVFGGDGTGLRIRVRHIADEFLRIIDTLEFFHGKKVVRKVRPIHSDEKRHGSIALRLKVNRAQRDVLFVTCVGCNSFCTLHIPSQSKDGYGYKQANEQNSSQIPSLLGFAQALTQDAISQPSWSNTPHRAASQAG